MSEAIKNSVDVEMTPSQEKSIQSALCYLADEHFLGDSYRFREIRFHPSDSSKNIMVSVLIDNNKPGTLGYSNPSHFIFHVGAKGCIYILRDTKRKDATKSFRRITGVSALIHCQEM